MRRATLAAAALLALLLPTAATAAPQVYINHVPMGGMGETFQAPFSLSGRTIDFQSSTVGDAVCDFQSGGSFWDPTSVPGVAGKLEGVSIYHCQQQGSVCLHVYADARYNQPFAEGSAGEQTEPIFQEANGTLSLHLGEGHWALKCETGRPMPIDGLTNYPSEWENGTAEGSAPSHWRIGGPGAQLETSPGPPRKFEPLEVRFTGSVDGYEATELLTRR